MKRVEKKKPDTKIDVTSSDFHLATISVPDPLSDVAYQVIAHYQGQEIGYLKFSPLSQRINDSFYIGKIKVEPEYERNGVFGAMYDQAVAVMNSLYQEATREQKHPPQAFRVAVDPNKNRDLLVGFFQKRGYDHEGGGFFCEHMRGQLSVDFSLKKPDIQPSDLEFSLSD